MGDLTQPKYPEDNWIDSNPTTVLKDLINYHNPEFIWLRFMPPCGLFLCTMVPVKRFEKMIKNGERTGMTAGLWYGMPNCHVLPPGGPTGTIYLEPDLHSAYVYPGDGAKLEIMCSYVDKAGAQESGCARSKLPTFTNKLRIDHGLDILLGFEIEVHFLKPTGTTDVNVPMFEQAHPYTMFCGTTADDETLLPVAEQIVRKLAQANVDVEKFHVEVGSGQWEFVLPPRSPLEAVDMLVRAREIISIVARQYEYRATLHPRPFQTEGGNGAHAHISANPTKKSGTGNPEHFFGGIMAHLPALTAFLMPFDDSYQRVVTDMWTGGEYVSWGWENKETPMRRVSDERFELRTLCGTANPYVAMCAVLASGINGLEKKTPLAGKDCQGKPGSMTKEEREELGIVAKIPPTLDEALVLLDKDEVLLRMLGDPLVPGYIAITRGWNEHLRTLGAEERWNWLVQNY